MVENKEGILVPTRLVTSWHMSIDYWKLNSASQKDNFPLPFIDQVLERVASHPLYCCFMGTLTTYTCPFRTYVFRRMPFGLCNAPTTFQKCMMSIFSGMVEKCMEVFMDDLTMFGTFFE